MVFYFLTGETFNCAVQITIFLSTQVQILAEFLAVSKHFFSLSEVVQLVDEPAVDHGDFMDLFCWDAFLQCFIYTEDTLIIAVVQQLKQLFFGLVSKFWQVEAV